MVDVCALALALQGTTREQDSEDLEDLEEAGGLHNQLCRASGFTVCVRTKYVCNRGPGYSFIVVAIH